MYEIWLMLNIVFELALAAWPWLLVLGVAWLLLMARAWRQSRTEWRASLPGALLLGAGVATLAFFFVPTWVGSSLADMKYWVDWANLLGIAAACGVLGLALAWPLLTGLRRPQAHRA